MTVLPHQLLGLAQSLSPRKSSYELSLNDEDKEFAVEYKNPKDSFVKFLTSRSYPIPPTLQQYTSQDPASATLPPLHRAPSQIEPSSLLHPRLGQFSGSSAVMSSSSLTFQNHPRYEQALVDRARSKSRVQKEKGKKN